MREFVQGDTADVKLEFIVPALLFRSGALFQFQTSERLFRMMPLLHLPAFHQDNIDVYKRQTYDYVKEYIDPNTPGRKRAYWLHCRPYWF